jgi:hypothetical protein
MHCLSLRWVVFLALLFLVPGVTAFSLSSTSVDPEILNPGDAVNVSCTVVAASGTSFSSFDDLQFITTLDDPVWTYTVIVGGVENSRPANRGRNIKVGGYELSYPSDNEVIVEMTLKGQVPPSTPDGTELYLITVQELDAKNRVITSSVTEIKHLVGKPTPAPTPEYGQITVTSEPAGANVFLDNTLRGITPMTIKAVPNGRHTVTLRFDGYDDAVQDVTVTADAPQVSAVLAAKGGGVGSVYTVSSGSSVTGTSGSSATQQATTETGSLSVTTTPPGAFVYIDGQMKGISPSTIPGLSPGTHTIRLTLDGYQDFETTTEITAGSTSEFVTGLSLRKQAPGFEAVVALAALGFIFVIFSNRNRDR